MNISFDLDGVLINLPPLIPKVLISWFYRKNDTILHYRYPSVAEQQLRKLSHAPMFRPAMERNIADLRHIRRHTNHRLILLSGRFGFLRNETDAILKKYKLHTIFDKYCLNYQNNQPHFFKNALVKKYNIQKHIDDDLDMLHFLAGKNSSITFYWLNEKENKKISKNLFAITDLKKIL